VKTQRVFVLVVSENDGFKAGRSSDLGRSLNPPGHQQQQGEESNNSSHITLTNLIIQGFIQAALDVP
jgi:hypothetical protein